MLKVLQFDNTLIKKFASKFGPRTFKLVAAVNYQPTEVIPVICGDQLDPCLESLESFELKSFETEYGFE